MVELHGWLSIKETYKNEDLMSDAEIESVWQQVDAIMNNNTCGEKIQSRNGERFLNTLLCSNHHTAEVDEIIDIYTKISEVATGSYGLIYLWDDEDETHYNEYQVLVFKRGKCERRADTDFSPCIPMIEDEVLHRI